MEVNETSRNANGGTELMLRRLHRTLDPGLLAKFQIIPSRIRELDPQRIKILWLHNVPCNETQCLKDAEFRKQFAKIVMVSDWQMHLYELTLGLPFSECEVIRNGIEPIDAQPKPNPHERINIIYHTTPQRGLHILLAAFEQILASFQNVHLHVYSSLAVYGRPDDDEPFQPWFDWCRNHPHITYHGYQPNDVVRRALQESHIFGYPSVWEETSCIAAIEAMSARNIVVAPNRGALFDTCNRWALSYQWTQDPFGHQQRFTAKLSEAITGLRSDPSGYEAHLAAQKAFTDRFYNWNLQAQVWDRMLRSLLAQ